MNTGKALFGLVLLFIIHSNSPIFCQTTEQKPEYHITAAQSFKTYPSPALQSTPLAFVFSPPQAFMDLNPGLSNTIPRHKEAEESNPESILQSKLKKDRFFEFPEKNRPDVWSPSGPTAIQVGETFFGDIDGGCPNDNTIAISKSGKIISMMNSQVGIYNSQGSKLNKYSIYGFFNYLTNASPCDPKVEYDPVMDRFFAFVQDCGADDKIFNISVGFSKTNDPNGDWYIYQFSTDAFNDGSWSDYPKIAINKDEVFVSLNLFGKNGGSYRKSIVYQMDKKQGFAGQRLSYKIWDGFQTGTILLVRSGAFGLYGPGIYAIQTSSGGSDYINFYDITGDLSDPTSKLLYKRLPTDSYSKASAAYQLGTTVRLDVGDCRGLDAYYQNGLIHFVFTSNDGNNYAAIRYHRLDPVKLDAQNYTQIYSDSDRDYCYPSIAPFGSNANDHSAVVHFASSGESYYPDMRAKLFHHDFSSDPSIRVKVGPGPQKECYNGEYARWGDYTGIARHYAGNTPSVWIAGSIGNDISYSWWTFIAELYAVSTGTNDIQSIQSGQVYPNPAQNRVFFDIYAERFQKVRFFLYNESGELQKLLMENCLTEGHNKFSIETNLLTPGTYFLQIINDHNEKIKSEKFIVLSD